MGFSPPGSAPGGGCPSSQRWSRLHAPSSVLLTTPVAPALFGLAAPSLWVLGVLLVVSLAAADRIASLTTVGAPHRGTPLADLGSGTIARLGVRRALESVGVPLSALEDLTVKRMEKFNGSIPYAHGVAYGSVLGVALRKRKMN